MNNIAENLKSIHTNIGKNASQWNRKPSDINLIAVSKRQSQEKLTQALNAGHRLFGENRVQEAQEHWAHIKPRYPDLNLHLIGPLQTNKVKDAVALFDMIHTLDREKLARKLSNQMKESEHFVPCLIQINIGEEDQKSGIAPKDLPDFLNFCKSDCHLDIRGLMCIPPIDEPPALFFAFLQNMAHKHGLKHLSMGMSADYEKAIPLGATHIRIGTGVFGERSKIEKR